MVLTRSPTHAAALAYAALGWPVFPLAPRSKIPLIPKSAGGNGVLDATTDPVEINRLWSDCPDAGIGAACGIRSGWFAVDVDPRADGDESVAELEVQHGRFPPTVESCTGGGGRHLLYRCATDLRGTVLAMGIDIKAGGGYIVLPPSIHPGGRRYAWEASSRPGEVEIADPPPWLLERLTLRDGAPVVQLTDPADPDSFLLGSAFLAANMLGNQIRPGVWAVRCPNCDQHSDGRGDGRDSSAVLFVPREGKTRGLFRCSHGHCGELCDGHFDVLTLLPPEAVTEAVRKHPARLPEIDELDTYDEPDELDGPVPEDPEAAASHVLRELPRPSRRTSGPVVQPLPDVENERAVLGGAAQRTLAGPRTMFARTGHWYLDDTTGGIEAGMVWCLAAQSGWGKSTFAAAIADENLGKRRVLIGSTEDVSRIYGARILCRRTRVDAKRFKRGTLLEHEKQAVRDCMATVRDLPLFVNWNGVTAERIAQHMAELVKTQGIEIVLLDWLQKIPVERRCDNQRERVWHAYDTVSRTAKELGCALVVFSQTTPDGDSPTMNWIRDSKDVGMTSDVVVLGLCKDERDDMGGLLSRERRMVVAKVKDDEAGASMQTGWDSKCAAFLPVLPPTREEPPPDYSEDEKTKDLFDFDN